MKIDKLEANLVPDHCGGIDGREPEVHVGSHGGGLVLVLSLELPRLGASGWSKAGVKGHLQPGEELVSHVQRGVQGVVSRPFLSQCEAQVLDLVLGLQITSNFATVNVGAATAGELHPGVSLGLHLQLQQPKVVALTKNIPGLFSKISKFWWAHLLYSFSETTIIYQCSSISIRAGKIFQQCLEKLYLKTIIKFTTYKG